MSLNYNLSEGKPFSWNFNGTDHTGFSEPIYTSSFQTDLDFYISYFNGIEDQYWGKNLIYVYRKQKDVLGHLKETIRTFTRPSKYLALLVERFLQDNILKINDGTSKKYTQPSPKERVITALTDLKELTTPKQLEETAKQVEVLMGIQREYIKSDTLNNSGHV